MTTKIKKLSKKEALELIRSDFNINWYEYEDLLPLNPSESELEPIEKEDETENATS